MEKVICVVGPTSVGKTRIGIELAKILKTEIISGDSIQVYRGLDIGSAKVTCNEMKSVKHHLIDILNLNEKYSVYEFQKQARKIMEEMNTEHKIPLVVGGTGLYIKSLIYDYEFINEPNTIPHSYFDHKTNEELYAELYDLDSEAALKTHVNNRQRVMRALQLILSQKTSKSAIINAQNHEPIYDAYIIGLTCDRNILHERINARVDQMFDNGLLEELNQLSLIPNIFDEQGMQGIGYKEFKEYYEFECSLAEVREKIKNHSRQFAKRQYTWFNNQLDVHWYDIFKEDYEKDIIKDIEKWIRGEAI